MRSPRTLVHAAVLGALAVALTGCNDDSGPRYDPPGYTSGGSSGGSSGGGYVPDRVDPAVDPDGDGRFNPGPVGGPFSP